MQNSYRRWMRGPDPLGRGPPARRFEWNGSASEEFAPDKSASAGPVPAEPPAVYAGGPSRRNGSGAAAREKNGCNFPQRRQPNRADTTRNGGDDVVLAGLRKGSPL